MATDGDTLQNGDGQVLDPELAVEDDDYVRRRRLKAINDARDRVAEIPLRARLEQMDGNMTSRHREAAYTEAVQSFLQQAEMTIRKLEGAQEVLDSIEIGTWRLEPPARATDYRLLDVSGLVNCDFDTETLSVTAIGLRSLYESSAVYRVHWSINEQRHLGQDRSTETVTRQAFPEQVARQAFSIAVRFLDDAGVNFTPRQEEGMPMIKEFDQSGEEPKAELVKAEYTGDPDI